MKTLSKTPREKMTERTARAHLRVARMVSKQYIDILAGWRSGRRMPLLNELVNQPDRLDFTRHEGRTIKHWNWNEIEAMARINIALEIHNNEYLRGQLIAARTPAT